MNVGDGWHTVGNKKKVRANLVTQKNTRKNSLLPHYSGNSVKQSAGALEYLFN